MPRLAAHVVPLLACVWVWSCAGPGTGSVPGRLADAPGADPELAARLHRVRDQLLRGESAAALRVVEEILADHPQHVNSHRLRQDILRQRGRHGLVLSEAEARLAGHPRSPVAHYLAGRVADRDEAKQAAFRRAIALDPNNFWGWFGLAFTLRDADNATANRIYGQLFARTRSLRVGLAFAASLRRGDRHREASRVFSRLRRDHPGISALGRSESLLRAGRHKQAWPLVRRALEYRPFDGGVRAIVASLLAQGVPQDGIQELLDVLRADPARLRDFARGGGGLLAAMFERVGEPAAALGALRATERRTALERRAYRRLLLTCEGVPAYLADVASGIFAPFLADEGNQVRDRWQAVLSGPWMRSRDPLASPGDAARLARALLHAGLIQDADAVVSQARLRHPDGDSELPALHDEIRREIAFESGLRRVFSRGYARFALSRTRGSLEETLADLRKVSVRTLGKDVVGTPKRFDLPFVGTLIDSLGPGLPAHLARYNKHLVMGQRNGRPTEGMLLSRLSMRYVDPTPGVPLPPQSVEVIGEHRELEPLEQADLAGIALLNHYVVDMDEVRSWADGIAERRRIAAADGDALLRDPLPERLDPALPAGVDWRLALLSPVEDRDLDAAVLDIIRWHERGHMVDFQHLLPVERHPIRAIGMILRNGFSALAVAAEMEGRAELTALAMSPHTRLVAAHIAGFLAGEGGGSPHAHGFRSLVAEIQEHLRRRGVAPIDVRYWHQLEPDLLRAAGRELLRQLW